MGVATDDVVKGIMHFLYVEDLKFLVYLGIVILAFIFIYTNYRYYRRWVFKGQRLRLDHLGERVRRVLVYGFAQRKLLRADYPGTMHALIFLGLGGLTVSTMLRASELYFFSSSPILRGQIYLIFKLASNICGAMAIVGLSMALYRRLTGGTEGLPNALIDNFLLIVLLLTVLSGFVMDGISTLNYRTEWIGLWSPVGALTISFFRGFSPASIERVYRALWVIHLVLAYGSMALIPVSKLTHMWIGGIVNTFFSRLEPPGALSPIPNIYEIIEEDGTIGVQRCSETTWKQRMDFDSCVQCARCHNACPAQVSGKPLSPMEVVMNMRGLMAGDGWERDIWPGTVEVDTIWSCVACGACVSECPLLIDPVDTIMDLRRGLYFEEKNVPREIQEISFNIMNDGNPYGFGSSEKEEWTKGLVENGLCEYATVGTEYDYLYWISCVISYDPNLRGSAESLLKILKRMGKRVAILVDEQCCGDPARRIGDELMFVEVAKANHEALSRFTFERMLTSCPHCFNSFKFEYPQYGFEIDVEHYTTTVDELLRETSPDLKIDGGQTVTFHDPCYLGRWNKIYDAPRKIIESIDGVTLKEMDRTREKSFCCGGGGGHMFYEIKEGERISKLRMEESLQTDAETLLVACPYCNTMLKSEASEKIKVMDIAELLEAAMERADS